MSTTRLGLYFRELPKDGVPGRPVAHVFAKMFTKHRDPDGHEYVFLTPREYGPEMVGNQIDALMAELQEIKAEVRTRYARYERKIRNRQ